MEAEKGPDDDEGPLMRVPALEDLLGISKIFVKFEGRNPTGTHKDRIARLHVETAKTLGFSGITVGTCGNYGVALAYYARLFGLKAYIFVPAGYTLGRSEEMLRYGARIIPVHGPYEKAVLESRKFAVEKGLYDANPGSHPEIDYLGYAEIAKEIALRINPYAVFVPVGNGTTLSGIHYGFKALGLKPRMVGVTTSFGNQVLREFYGVDGNDFAETEFNEPLVSIVSFDRDAALKAVNESGGYIFGFADDTALYYASLLKGVGINALPASALTLAGLVKFVRKFGVNGKNFVLVVTGGVKNGRGPTLDGRALSVNGWKDRARVGEVLQKV
ncbi:pyridoxal-phosphate dependent enzyme [Thermococcus sp. CX2]|uniref:pyridoxal-phosphate dependent enzyme n=1 Tax=Thermococcus sp. CX2 TaxID=163006 RepID=UPI00143ACA94|nr:pyridoxal-phosphate dependent enzyme [Thermococcus sp. CX2]NJE85841.1 pyridoxal-phosphate dependent enzyme [Thermococcus sp. CX2]